MEGVNASIKKGPGLYEFLVEAELQHYFNSFKNTLKIAHPSQLKFTAESDLVEIGMSKPEMRRLRKYYDKHFPHNYLSKLKKIINYRKQGQSSNDAYLLMNMDSLSVSRAPRVSSKHIIPAASITINKELGMGEFGVVQQGVWCNEGERIQVIVFAVEEVSDPRQNKMQIRRLPY
jgi:activated CDC42 kinase 1